MRLLAALPCLLLTVLAAGCASDQGTLAVQVTDGPANIDDFTSLNITVSSIDIQGDGGSHSYTPAHPTFDLTKLTSGNTTTLFKDSVASGNYSRLELHITSAVGQLKAGGQVDVKAPSGTLFVEQRFTVGGGATTTFTFDIHVVKKGSGDYGLQPNVSGSRAS